MVSLRILFLHFSHVDLVEYANPYELVCSCFRLRDEVRNLPCTYKCRHDAAADLIHIYAHTKCFFRLRVNLIILS